MTAPYRAHCPECGEEKTVKRDGTVRWHNLPNGSRCLGSNTLPISIRCGACEGSGRIPVPVDLTAVR